jgi:hypothetical protein
MNAELERIWNEAVMAHFQVLSWYSPGGNEENHKKPQSEQPVSRPRFEPITSQMWSRSATIKENDPEGG